MSSPAMVSIGDSGVLNREIAQPLAEVWIDRDLSWLDFNDRVLAEALDERTPLLERVKFLAIFTSNLDEFFMKRVAVLREQTAPEQTTLLARIHSRLVASLDRQADCFREHLLPQLAAHGIHLRQWDGLTPAQREEAERYFDSEVSRGAHAAGFRSGAPLSVSLEPLHLAGVFAARPGERDNLLRARESTGRVEAMDLAGRRTCLPGRRCSFRCMR